MYATDLMTITRHKQIIDYTVNNNGSSVGSGEKSVDAWSEDASYQSGGDLSGRFER